MELKRIYNPIQKELDKVERLLRDALRRMKDDSIPNLTDYLLESSGKRLRPALVILSARAGGEVMTYRHLLNLAGAVELIHIASLIHDDIIDHAVLRHNKPTINARYGQEVSIALGDYLYSVAFELISQCGNMDILRCISSATKAMCAGELLQVCERDDLELLKENYILIVKKKTAGIFAASCKTGAMLSNCPKSIYNGLRDYGLNFGIAFQIIDDCLDLIGEEKDLGKSPGADFKMGELTLPVLNLLAQGRDKNRIISLIKQPQDKEAFKELKQIFIDSPAFIKTKQDTLIYIRKAKKSLSGLKDSRFKRSLFDLVDYILDRFQA